MKIEEDFLRRLRGFLGEEHGHWLHWERLAVTDTDFYKTRPDGKFEYLGFEAKKKGAVGSYQPYIDQYGDRCVEVDAIPSQELRDRVEEAIRYHIAFANWEDWQEQEKAEAKEMREKFGLETVGEEEAEEKKEDSEERSGFYAPVTEEERSNAMVDFEKMILRDAVLLKRVRAKIGRAYKKAGKQDAPEEEKDMFCGQLIKLGVPVEHRTSARIARVIQGEHPPEWLFT